MHRLAHLRKTELFRCLSDDELVALERDLPMRRLPAGEQIPTGDLARRLHVVKKGRIRVFRLSARGREVTLAVCRRDDVFGRLPALGGSATRNLAQAETDALVCSLDESRFRQLASRHPEVAVTLVEALGRQLAAREELVADLTFRSAEERVARVVLRMADRHGGGRIRTSHAEVARAAGVVRETATKTLGRMERDGLIALAYGSLTVLDAPRLARRAGAEPGEPATRSDHAVPQGRHHRHAGA